MKNLFLSILFILSGSLLLAQGLDPVKWDYKAVTTPEFTKIIFTADIQEGWYLYAQELPEGGPIPTSFNFETDGALNFPALATEKSEFTLFSYDEMFGMELKKYKHQVTFTYQIAKASPIKNLKGYLEFMCCDGTQCLAPKIIEFSINLK